MKFLLYFSSIFFLFACSAERVVERSQKPRPTWVFGLEQNYLIVQGVGKTHEDAKNAAYLNLKEKIVNSVAVNVSASVSYLVNEKVVNKISTYQEKFQSSTKVNSNLLSAIKGISLNKATSFYWEIKRMPDKQRRVFYHVKYPFSEIELNKLINEWEQLDKQLLAELNQLKVAFETESNIEKLQDIQFKAAQLVSVFIEPRKSSAELLVKQVSTLLTQAALKSEKHEPGQLWFQIKSQNRILYNSNLPKVKSNCAQIEAINYLPDAMAYIVSYETNFCGENQENKLSVDFESRLLKLNADFQLPKDPNVAQLSLIGNLRLIPPRSGTSKEREWELTIRSYNDLPFEIIEIGLTVKRTSQRTLAALGGLPAQYFERKTIQKRFVGKQDFVVFLPSVIKFTEIDNMVEGLLNRRPSFTVSGKITYKMDLSPKIFTYNFEKVKVDLK